MQIIQLKPYYFRSFGDSSPIIFADHLTIFYGGNGAGKSSLAEALEWLFYGYTKRRRKGDQYSKNEYKGSYINCSCPSGEIPYVEVEVILSDGSKHILRRTMKKDEHDRISDTESNITMDGKEIADFSVLGVSSDSQCPIVVQHGIQDFIHTRPIDRYRTISEALGLSDLTKFKDALEQAKNRYKSNPPQKVIESRATLNHSIKALEMIGFKNIATSWQKGEVDGIADSQAIFNRACELTGSQAETIQDLVNDVRNRQALEISKLFNIAPYQPNPNLDSLLQEIEAQFQSILHEQLKIFTTATSLAESFSLRYSQLQIAFWQRGLTLLSQNAGVNPQDRKTDACPFCEEQTLTDIKLEEIRSRTLNVAKVEEKREQLDKELKEIESSIIQLEGLFSRIEVATISAQDVSALKRIFARGEKSLDEFTSLNVNCSKLISTIKVKSGSLKTAIHQLQSKTIRSEDLLPSIGSLQDFIEDLRKTHSELSIMVRNYATIFLDFLPILQRELSDEQTVAIFSSLIELLTTKPQIELLVLAKEFEGSILQCQQTAEDYILNQQKSILGIREKDILDWYGRLSPNPDVRFSGLEPGKNEFNLKATAFGKELNAAASLSQSQLNCLGLSVYIPSIVAPDAPFHFIVFDDPVQAMDDDHHEAFLLKVVPELLGTFQRQVIVLTHLKQTADRLRSLNCNCSPTYYRLEKLTPDGPQIRVYIALKEEAKQIRDLAEGNEENRILSVDRLRVFCEIVMKEAYLKINGVTIPLDLKNPRQILQAFRKLKGVTPSITQQLDDTIGWSDPSHHTDPDWQVPDTPAIKLHIDRLQSIIGTLGLHCD